MSGLATDFGRALREAQADFEPRLHPRGRAGRFIRVHFTDGSKALLRVNKLDLNRFEGEYVNEHGEPTKHEGYDLKDVDTFDVQKIEELVPDHETGKLRPRDVLMDGPAAEHLDLMFLGATARDDQAWVAKLTTEEKDALHVWSSPEGYAALNGALRNGTAKQTEYTRVEDRQGPPPLYEPQVRTTRTVAEWVRLMDDALAKAPPTDTSLGLNMYRGIRDWRAVFGPDGPHVGQHVHDPGYVSTTTEPELARNFAYAKAWWLQDEAPAPMLLEIETPPGVQGAWMAGIFGSGFKEYTLPRGSTFEVTDMRSELGKEPGDRITVVEMKLVPDERKGDRGTDIRFASDYASIYDGFEHDGMKVHILDARQVNHPNATTRTILSLAEVQGEIREGQRGVGVFEHRLQVDEHGDLMVYRDFQAMQPEYQGRGFFSAFNRHAEEHYREQGVSRVRLGTVQVGGYAWARAGFEFDPSYYGLFAGMKYGADVHEDERFIGAFAARRLFNERISDPPFTDRRNVPEAVWQEFEGRFATQDQLRAYADGDEHALDGVFQSPSEIATFGRDHVWTHPIGPYAGQQMWLGKRFMLDSKWNGVKWLKPKPS